MRLLYGQTVVGNIRIEVTVRCCICGDEQVIDLAYQFYGVPFTAKLPEGWSVLNMGPICPAHPVLVDGEANRTAMQAEGGIIATTCAEHGGYVEDGALWTCIGEPE